ncbi:MAG: hypothetical protein ACJ768_21420 [Gaiellaceae bacterium]
MAEAMATEALRHPPARVAQPVPLGRLAGCVQALDPGPRALLDLSLRRGLRDEAIAAIVHEDPFRLAWARARAIERVAEDMGATGPAALRAVRLALPELPAEAWGVPTLPPPPPPGESTSTKLVEQPLADPPALYEAKLVRRRPRTLPPGAVRSAALATGGAVIGMLLRRRRRR